MNQPIATIPNEIRFLNSNPGGGKPPLPWWKTYGPEVILGLLVNLVAAVLYDEGKSLIKQQPQFWILPGIFLLITIQFSLIRHAYRKGARITQQEFETTIAQINATQEQERTRWRTDFKNDSELIHQIVHHARDLGIKLLPRYRDPGRIPRKEVVQMYLQDLSEVLNLMADLFEPRAPSGAKVWVALRELRADNRFHTLLRTRNCHPNRAERSESLSQQSNIVQTLKDSYRDKEKRDCVILSGSGCVGWQKMENDALGEDRCVLMAAVFSKSWDGESMKRPVLTWILCVNADKEFAFAEEHKPLMRACNDVFSWILNEFVRYQTDKLKPHPPV